MAKCMGMDDALPHRKWLSVVSSEETPGLSCISGHPGSKLVQGRNNRLPVSEYFLMSPRCVSGIVLKIASKEKLDWQPDIDHSAEC